MADRLAAAPQAQTVEETDVHECGRVAEPADTHGPPEGLDPHQDCNKSDSQIHETLQTASFPESNKSTVLHNWAACFYFIYEFHFFNLIILRASAPNRLNVEFNSENIHQAAPGQ